MFERVLCVVATLSTSIGVLSYTLGQYSELKEGLMPGNPMFVVFFLLYCLCMIVTASRIICKICQKKG